MASGADTRIRSVDVYRGLVLLLLLPDPTGAFSLHRTESLAREGSPWRALVMQFQHSEWSGVTLWDLVMPAFVFLIGISIALSWRQRTARGEATVEIATHAVLRAVALVILGLLLSARIDGLADQVWPLVVLSLGLPFPRLVADRLDLDARGRLALEAAWWSAVLLAAALHYGSEARDVGIYESANLLVQVGLAFLPAYLVVGLRIRTQAVVALGVLAAYWLAFVLYPAPEPGLFSHWAKNANFASAADTWFFGLFPRAEPFQLHASGLQTLNFVPMTANMIFGVMAGTLLARSTDRALVRNRLLLCGAVGVAAGWAAGLALCPIVKPIWTPSYALFSGGCTALALAVLYQVYELRDSRAWTLPFVVLGANSILLYTLSYYYRWRILQGWEFAGGVAGLPVPFPPLAESLLVIGSLWALGYVLYRRGIFVRI